MKSALIVVSDNLSHNSSACLAHAAYIKGFCDNGFKVRVIMPDCEEADKDPAISLPQTAEYLVFSEKGSFSRLVASTVKSDAFTTREVTQITKIKNSIRRFLSRIRQRLLKLFSTDLFPNSSFFIKEVLKHRDVYNNQEYEYIISLSSPVSAHYLAELIIKKTGLRYKQWIQIWEDPWYYDLYAQKEKSILREEKRLLSLADLIEYVTPLTCYYQKQYFPEYAEKMHWTFLPYNNDLFRSKTIKKDDGVLRLGYFGEYVTKVRNIVPLVDAVGELNGIELIVCGRSDIDISGRANVMAKGRVSVDLVNDYQSICDCLVNVSNLRGGQIPGKIYQYAATDKTILYILDGTNEEKEIIRNTFNKYNRFVFCDNDKESILKALQRIIKGDAKTDNSDVSDFSPQCITSKIEDHATKQ